MSSAPFHAFTDVEPSASSFWRGIVLFGRNVASYKFALAKSLLELAQDEREEVPLGDLARPFASHICEHLEQSDKQSTSPNSRFLDACRAFNREEIEHGDLLESTARLGFQNVIDAFHVVGRGPVPVTFFEDERKGSSGGIRLTDDMHRLASEMGDLSSEAESRWRLVETAWSLDLPAHLIAVGYSPEDGMLLTPDKTRRKPLTSARSALNGYQKGRCFYCFGRISVDPGADDLAHVDHFFPHVLKRMDFGTAVNLDGIWNVVLACSTCNAGSAGKFDSLPAVQYLERLHQRNEFLIGSNLPLRETLIAQTGADPKTRVQFLQGLFDEIRLSGFGAVTWSVKPRAPAAF